MPTLAPRPCRPQVFEWVMCSNSELDSHRFADMVEAAIAAKEAKPSKAFAAWAKKVRARPAPADPLAPPKKGGKAGKAGKQKADEMALIAQIRCGRQACLAWLGWVDWGGVEEGRAFKWGSGWGGRARCSSIAVYSACKQLAVEGREVR